MEPLTKATPRATREHNERLVLASVYDAGQASRADAARQTGLTRTTVSDLVAGLLASGLLREVGRGPSTGGKAPILLTVPDDARLLVGVDLGDRTIVAAIVDLRGEVRRRVEAPAGDVGGTQAMEIALGLVGRLLDGPHGRVLGVGVGAAGLVDPSSGTVIEGVMRDWRDLPLGPLMGARLRLPVHVANDSVAAALGEHVFGEVRGASLIAVKVGEGIGAGLILNGSPFEGDGFGAGEIGHTVVEPSGTRCRCGRRGCLETVASARAILGRLSERLRRPVGIADAVELLGRDDPVALEVVGDAGARLGAVVGVLIGALHVRRIVLTGPAAALGEPWLRAVRETARSSALAPLAEDTAIELRAGDDIVALGAAALLMTRELGLRLRPRSGPPGEHARGTAGPAPRAAVAR